VTVVEQASLNADLAEMLGNLAVSAPTERHVIDGITPQVVVAPADYGEVSQVLAYANARHLALTPLGGSVHAGLGNMPARYDIALETRRITGIVEFEPADLTITLRAGTTLGELRRLTENHNMMVPFDPEIPDRATVGGVLAANASGPGRSSLGQPRDFTIGMRVVTADGRLSRAGGRVVKNVAGYDLCKLYIGSLGTLAVIVEASLKTVPLPLKQIPLAFAFTEADPACRLVIDAIKQGLKVGSALVSRQDNHWRTQVHLAGTPEAVARSEFDIAAAASKAGGRQVQPDSEHPDRPSLIARLETLPPKVPALLADAATELPATRIGAQPWEGICRISGSEDALLAIQQLAQRHQASLLIECCGVDTKRALDVFGQPPNSFPLMRAVKEQFDPNRVLSPGRFLGRM
jgi:glycolate oxidase FAD binding subunit